MDLLRTCLTRPVAVSVGVILVVLSGVLSIRAIPVQLTPNVDQPVINITTNWFGSNAAEVERDVVDRQEEFLRSVKGLRQMTSKSQDGLGTITLEFYTGVDKAEALRDVNDKLRQVPAYPEEVDEPVVVAADTARDSEIAWLILRATDGNDERLTELDDFARDHIKPYLDRVEGVASTDVYGGRRRQIDVLVDAGKLAAHGLTFMQLEAALRGQNRDVSAGAAPSGKLDYAVRAVGRYENVDDIRRTVIAYTAGGPVYVRDVADVELSHQRQTSFVRSRGEYVLAFPVRREVGSNVIRVMGGLREAVAAVNREQLAGRGVALELNQIYDETVYIDQATNLVRESAVVGGVLTVVILMLFLRSWRATAALSLAIPISVIGAFVAMVALGRTINVISLAGIAFSIGMVVDDSIVVLENIFRHRELGKSVLSACYDGAREVWGAVLASTLTTMVVFIPVILVQEEAGQLFRDISVATVASIGLSFFVAVLVMPPLLAKLLSLRGGGRIVELAHTDAADASQGRVHLPARVTAAVFAIFARRRGLRVAAVLGATALALLLAYLLTPPASYLPAGNRNLVFGFLFTPPGYSIDEFKRMGTVIEAMIKPYWECDTPEKKRALDEAWVQRVGGMIDAGAIPELAAAQGADSWRGALERGRARREWLEPPPLIEDFFYVSFNGGCIMGATSQDPARVKPLARLLTAAGGQIPGTYSAFFQTQLFRESGGNNAEIQVRGDNLGDVTAAADALFGAIMARYGFPSPDPANFNLGRPELRVEADREKAVDVGMTPEDVAFVVSCCVDGAFVGEYRAIGSSAIDIRLKIRDQLGKPAQQLAQVPVYTPTGRVVPLGSVTRQTETTALETIKRVERQRAVTLTVNPPETEPLERVMGAISGEMVTQLRQAGAIKPGVSIGLAGNASKLDEAREVMIGKWSGWSAESLFSIGSSRFLLSVLVCFLLLVALYESWVYPAVIMFSVPLAVFGGMLGLWLCNVGTLLTTNQPVQQLDVLTFLGFVILVGTVVKNAIILVDQALQNFRDHGMSIVDAVAASVRSRTRPVLMTSLTTFFAQLPLALIPGAGSELYRGLAAVCAAGMLISTVGTLLLIPAALLTAMELRERNAASRTPAAHRAGAPADHDAELSELRR